MYLISSCCAHSMKSAFLTVTREEETFLTSLAWN
jgi:hypothetical protein